jgi:hypothetical protein
MLALAIALLFTATGVAAMIAVADSAMKARTAYARLMAEAAVMRSGYELSVAAHDVRLRRSAPRPTADRRAPLRLAPARLACAAA